MFDCDDKVCLNFLSICYDLQKVGEIANLGCHLRNLYVRRENPSLTNLWFYILFIDFLTELVI